MKKRLVIFLLVLLSFQLPLHTYSVKGSTPCPVDTSPDEWKLQWTYPKAKRIINLKELYIKEDEKGSDRAHYRIEEETKRDSR